MRYAGFDGMVNPFKISQFAWKRSNKILIVPLESSLSAVKQKMIFYLDKWRVLTKFVINGENKYCLVLNKYLYLLYAQLSTN